MLEEVSIETLSFLEEDNQQHKTDTVAVLELSLNVPACVWDKTTPAVWRTQFLPQLSKRDIQEQAAMSLNQTARTTHLAFTVQMYFGSSYVCWK